jgi:predicted regulator of Ras-like GTPase activity (Roadblock/LC7/MglB family)
MKFFKFTKEGLPIDSDFSQEIDEGRIAAMSAAILSVSERYVKEYGIGNLKRILLDAGDVMLVLSKQGEEGFLRLMASDNDPSLLEL